MSLSTIQKKQSQEETFDLISELASDKFLGRETGTLGHEMAAAYVESFFAKNKLRPYFQGSYKDTVEVYGKASYNIVALIGDQDRTKKHVLIGAHLDHIGQSSSRTDSVYNGANDNASGVTAVLQIAKHLNKHKFDQNIIIALFTGEEEGLAGSRHLAQKLKSEQVNLSYVLNFEMIGKTLSSGENQVYITGYDYSNLAEEMNKITDSTFVKFLPAELPYSLYRRSDNFPFAQIFNIPSHTISTFDFENYDHYHSASDEVKQLDVKNMNTIINTSTFVISRLLVNDVQLKSTTGIK